MNLCDSGNQRRGKEILPLLWACTEDQSAAIDQVLIALQADWAAALTNSTNCI
jgi:hypothetical protein